jgi:hypothetical protein
MLDDHLGLDVRPYDAGPRNLLKRGRCRRSGCSQVRGDDHVVDVASARSVEPAAAGDEPKHRVRYGAEHCLCWERPLRVAGDVVGDETRGRPVGADDVDGVAPS